MRGGADQAANIYWYRTAPVSGVVATDWLAAPAVAGPFTILCVGVKKKGRIERESRRGGGEGPDRTEPGPRPPAPKPAEPEVRGGSRADTGRGDLGCWGLRGDRWQGRGGGTGEKGWVG